MLVYQRVESFSRLHSRKLTWQWKMDPLKMNFLLKMGMFQPAMLVCQRVHCISTLTFVEMLLLEEYSKKRSKCLFSCVCSLLLEIMAI